MDGDLGLEIGVDPEGDVVEKKVRDVEEVIAVAGHEADQTGLDQLGAGWPGPVVRQGSWPQDAGVVVVGRGWCPARRARSGAGCGLNSSCEALQAACACRHSPWQSWGDRSGCNAVAA